MSDELFVHLNGVFMGVYSQTSGGATTFEYDRGYVDGRAATPLSASLPLGASRHPARAVNGYFAGLVPEGAEALQKIDNTYRLRGKLSAFNILRHIGRDAPGAVQILPPDEVAGDAANARGDVTRLTNETFVELVTDLAQAPDDYAQRAEPGKWSLPGAQRKVALFRFEDGSWGIPNDSTPTTHILKPAIPGFANHDVNEYLSMRAARSFGIATANTTIEMVSQELSVLVSERYDRYERGGQWQRLHQEDICQALSVLPKYKYQKDSGPGIADIADHISGFPNSEDRDISRKIFFDAMVFNAAAWATDGHAKNYSIMLRGSRQTLAPLYDIASHAPYPPGGIPDSSAMKIGDEYLLSRIGKKHLMKAAARIRVDSDWASERVDVITRNVTNAYAAAADELVGSPLLESAGKRVVDSIRAKSRERGWIDDAAHIDLAPRL